MAILGEGAVSYERVWFWAYKRVKSLRSSYTGVVPQSNFTRSCILRGLGVQVGFGYLDCMLGMVVGQTVDVRLAHGVRFQVR